MKEKQRKTGTVLLLAAGIGMCIFGAMNGQAEEVFMKAVKICMECIGLG